MEGVNHFSCLSCTFHPPHNAVGTLHINTGLRFQCQYRTPCDGPRKRFVVPSAPVPDPWLRWLPPTKLGLRVWSGGWGIGGGRWGAALERKGPHPPCANTLLRYCCPRPPVVRGPVFMPAPRAHASVAVREGGGGAAVTRHFRSRGGEAAPTGVRLSGPDGGRAPFRGLQWSGDGPVERSEALMTRAPPAVDGPWMSTTHAPPPPPSVQSFHKRAFASPSQGRSLNDGPLRGVASPILTTRLHLRGHPPPLLSGPRTPPPP